jgi:hypothetical protein
MFRVSFAMVIILMWGDSLTRGLKEQVLGLCSQRVILVLQEFRGNI